MPRPSLRYFAIHSGDFLWLLDYYREEREAYMDEYEGHIIGDFDSLDKAKDFLINWRPDHALDIS
jgi:hypothetical protein